MALGLSNLEASLGKEQTGGGGGQRVPVQEDSGYGPKRSEGWTSTCAVE
jgi:hypothetical protein